MNKYSEIKEKIKIAKRIYLIKMDKVVLFVSFLCFFWIILYKLLLSNIKPIFDNGYNISANIADIIYAVFSSIIAAGIFYYFTVFMPKCSMIKSMRIQLFIDIKQIDSISKTLIEVIDKGNTKIKYTIDDFPIITKDPNFALAKIDFENWFVTNGDLVLEEITFSYLKSYVEPIFLNYSNILPQEIITILNDFKFRSFNIANVLIKMKNEVQQKDKRAASENYFMQLVQARFISNVLRMYYNLKE